jgi:hypothetical protein
LVFVDVSSDDPSASTIVGGGRLTFSSANWDEDHKIVVAGVPGGGGLPSNVVIVVDDAASDPLWSGLSESVPVTTVNVPAPQDE